MLLFDTGKKLEKAFTQEQFDALVEVLESREGKAATKEDLRETELRLQLEIEKLRGETEKVRGETEKVRGETEKVRAEVEQTKAQLQADISQLRIDTARDLREMEMRMVIKLGGMLAACVAATAALLRIIS